MIENGHKHPAMNPGRRAFLRFTASSLAVPLGAMAPVPRRMDRSSAPDTLIRPPICHAAADGNAVAPDAAPRVIKVSFSPNAVCTVGIPVAEQLGFFARRNIKIEKINFSTTSDQLLELLASGKADAGVSMALGWLKPLEQGFDVRLTAGIHGGCIRLLTSPDSGVTSVAALKGKAVGTFAMASP
ncbi:MAG: ABC transporter substrate-binding protein, partial [Xanthobacteraceae bacterium]|nr:ABC transporter substrate-binding protein [Xanthobacteraceae bacterium]